MASAVAVTAARHIDGPCGTVFPDRRTTATTAHPAVSNGAPIAASTHTSLPNVPVRAPMPIASFTSPAPIAAGDTRCTTTYTANSATAPSVAGAPRPFIAAAATMTAAPGI